MRRSTGSVPRLFRSAASSLKSYVDTLGRKGVAEVVARCSDRTSGLVSLAKPGWYLWSIGIGGNDPVHERQVAAFVRNGGTNREIAQALFVSEKAVEYHLGNAYRKLGVRSRTELAVLLERHPE